ncbi:uncharacterized protein [Linepithema humile]|uniref:uncharacterized protein n=1 Tax=Linepithema humile TaxID=83485 RepID=UPI00351EB513
MSQSEKAGDMPGADAAQIGRVSVRVPPFWPEEPELWFAQLESQFLLSAVTSDSTKYAYAISQIETKYIKEIKDVITNPPTCGKYEAVKRALIQRLSDSQEHRIRQLLEREELGDRKPSQFLRHLRTLAGNAVPDQLLRTLWLGRLPAQMQIILATRTDDLLEDVAEQADRVYEVTCRTVAVLDKPKETKSKPTGSLEDQIQALVKQVAALNTRLGRQEHRHKQQRHRSRSRSRTKSNSEEDSEFCFFHRRFGSKARKCTEPCTYKEKKKDKTEN